MKMKILTKLLVPAITVSILLTGCGNEQTGGTEDNIQISKEQEVNRDNNSENLAGQETKAINLNDINGNDTKKDETEDSEVIIFSLEDVPELSNVDWELFNEAVTECLGKSFEASDLFDVVGADPRVDWVEVNNDFNKYYGDNLDGMCLFVGHLYETYQSGYKSEEMGLLNTMCVQPMANNDENGVYESIYEEYKAALSQWGGYSSCEEEMAHSMFNNSNRSAKMLANGCAVLLSNYENSVPDNETTTVNNKRSVCLKSVQIYDSLVKANCSDMYEEYLVELNSFIADWGIEVVYTDLLK